MSDITDTSYVVHNDKEIKGFRGEYRWLSNFWRCPVSIDGLIFPSSENAYQSLKVSPDLQGKFCVITPAESKKKGAEWNQFEKDLWTNLKYDMMFGVLFAKFHQNLDLRQKLLETVDMYLEESNNWKDSYWGVHYSSSGKFGSNHMGKILMKIRSLWL